MNSFDSFEAELLQIFREEVGEFTDELGQALEALPKARGQEAIDRLNGVMRVLHNIKGAASTVGIKEIVTLAHDFEDAFVPYRQNAETPDDKLIELTFRAIALIEQIAAGEEKTAQSHALLAELKNLSERSKGEAASPAEEVKAVLEARVEASENPAETEETETAAAKDVLAGATVRVDTARIDHLMTFAGELFIAQARSANRLEQFKLLANDFREIYLNLDDSARKSLADVLKRLELALRADRLEQVNFRRLTEEIGSAMKRMRMLPINEAAAGWRRIVREISAELDKKAKLTIEVGDLELDKYILENLRDPLMHLLRNAIDHGLEAPDKRKAAGKDPVGEIRIKAAMRGSMVELEVADDGRGFNVAEIRAAAVKKGFMDETKVNALSDDEILSLLFQPGFTTSSQISKISGRGVGLDIVKRRLEELGGGVRISRKKSLGGATFVLTLPTSLLSVRGLLVSSGEKVCALPVDYIVRTARFPIDSIKKLDGASVVMQKDDEPLRLLNLAAVMGDSFETDSFYVSVVVARWEGLEMGLAVHSIIGEQEFVSRNLPWNLKNVGGVGGAVVLGDGRLAAVIDVPYIIKNFFKSDPASPSPRREDAAKPKKTRALVVDDVMTIRALHRNILTAGGYEVSLAIDGADAWRQLQSKTFDLVVSDIMMPNMNGFELTRAIRADKRLKHTPVILVTNMADDGHRREGLEAGADEYLVKNQYDQETLLASVKKLINPI